MNYDKLRETSEQPVDDETTTALDMLLSRADILAYARTLPDGLNALLALLRKEKA